MVTIKYLWFPIAGGKSVTKYIPHWSNGIGELIGIIIVASEWGRLEKNWHSLHLFTSSAASCFKVGQKYPCRKTLYARDLDPRWLPQTPACTSSNTCWPWTGSRHLSNRWENAFLYRIPSRMRYRFALKMIFFYSTGSRGRIPDSRYSWMGVIQPPTWSRWIGVTLTWVSILGESRTSSSTCLAKLGKSADATLESTSA